MKTLIVLLLLMSATMFGQNEKQKIDFIYPSLGPVMIGKVTPDDLPTIKRVYELAEQAKKDFETEKNKTLVALANRLVAELGNNSDNSIGNWTKALTAYTEEQKKEMSFDYFINWLKEHQEPEAKYWTNLIYQATK